MGTTGQCQPRDNVKESTGQCQRTPKVFVQNGTNVKCTTGQCQGEHGTMSTDTQSVRPKRCIGIELIPRMRRVGIVIGTFGHAGL
jgi:hypothetical protein